MSTSKTKKDGKSSAKQRKTTATTTRSQLEVKPGLKSWLKAFYKPITKARTWSDKKCFEHTLKKYEGTTPKVLTKYKLRRDTAVLEDVSHDFAAFNHDSCSLCKKYYNYLANNPCTNNPCKGCPIDTSGVRCGVLSKNPYSVFVSTGNPKPMIELMKKLISQCNKKGQWIGSDV